MGKSRVVEFLEDALEAIYVKPKEHELKFEEICLGYLKTPEGRNEYEKSLKESIEKGIGDQANIERALADTDSDIREQEERFQRRKQQHEKGKQEYLAFMKNHHNVVSYIAWLGTDGGKVPVKTPEEQLVFDTLRKLRGSLVMGELGFGAESMDATIYLDELVTQAAVVHALLIGENPKAYLSRVKEGQEPLSRAEAGQLPKVITL